MKYDFDKITNRRNTNSVKWDEMPDSNTIPLWVADMDFETAPCIVNALKSRMEHGCFGYTFVPESYYSANIEWFRHRHGWDIPREAFIYTSGVVPAISAIIKAIAAPGDKVSILEPVYNCFFSSIRNNGCEKTYFMDPEAKILLLCNPHNPIGHVWRKEELEEIAEFCHSNNIFVISDEIHCEFVNPDMDVRYTPFATVAKDDNYAVCISPSKAFNIAGLQIANIIAPDESIRKRIDKAININEVCDVNPFGVIALQAAYTEEGEEWLSQLNRYIYDNYNVARSFIEKHLPLWKVYDLEGTYLMWVDVSATGMTGTELADKLLKEHNIYVNPGQMYGDDNCIRINLATQRERVMTALEKLK